MRVALRFFGEKTSPRGEAPRTSSLHDPRTRFAMAILVDEFAMRYEGAVARGPALWVTLEPERTLSKHRVMGLVEVLDRDHWVGDATYFGDVAFPREGKQTDWLAPQDVPYLSATLRVPVSLVLSTGEITVRSRDRAKREQIAVLLKMLLDGHAEGVYAFKELEQEPDVDDEPARANPRRWTPPDLLTALHPFVDKGYFLHFTRGVPDGTGRRVPMLSVNVRARFDNPLGIYGYPLDRTHFELLRSSREMLFAASSPHAIVFRLRNAPRLFDAQRTSAAHAHELAARLGELFGAARVARLFERLEDDYSAPQMRIYHAVRALTKSPDPETGEREPRPARFTRTMQRLGYDGIDDSTGRTTGQPQLIVFSSRFVEVVADFANRPTAPRANPPTASAWKRGRGGYPRLREESARFAVPLADLLMLEELAVSGARLMVERLGDGLSVDVSLPRRARPELRARAESLTDRGFRKERGRGQPRGTEGTWVWLREYPRRAARTNPARARANSTRMTGLPRATDENAQTRAPAIVLRAITKWFGTSVAQAFDLHYGDLDGMARVANHVYDALEARRDGRSRDRRPSIAWMSMNYASYALDDEFSLQDRLQYARAAVEHARVAIRSRPVTREDERRLLGPADTRPNPRRRKKRA